MIPPKSRCRFVHSRLRYVDGRIRSNGVSRQQRRAARVIEALRRMGAVSRVGTAVRFDTCFCQLDEIFLIRVAATAGESFEFVHRLFSERLILRSDGRCSFCGSLPNKVYQTALPDSTEQVPPAP